MSVMILASHDRDHENKIMETSVARPKLSPVEPWVGSGFYWKRLNSF